MRIAILVLAVLLSGCITMPRYEWFLDPHQGPMDFYRWQVVEREDMIYRCHQEPQKGRELACVFRLNDGAILPGDKTLDGKPAQVAAGRLCVIFATHSEDEAKQLPAFDYEGTHFDHELRHCRGWLHNWIPGRIG